MAKRLREIAARIPWPVLIVLAVFLGGAPFKPQPHIIEKLTMLSAGRLSSPPDIFDLLFHTLPLLLIVIKFLFSKKV